MTYPLEAVPEEFSMEELKRRLKLSADMREAAKKLSHDEARFLVDTYYTHQEDRKRKKNQERALEESGEPCSLISILGALDNSVERFCKLCLGLYAEAHPAGAWALSNYGIGPVISAGLLAHIDITQAPTVGHIWSYAGLNPTQEWKKGERRPWNADLKTLTWKIGQCFMKFSNREECFYGQQYRTRKLYEIKRNEAGELADQAARKLEKFKIGKTTDAYKAYSAGMLPPAHIDARARRWAVKLFLSHFHHVYYQAHYGKAPAAPYILTQEGGHAHAIYPPNWP